MILQYNMKYSLGEEATTSRLITCVSDTTAGGYCRIDVSSNDTRCFVKFSINDKMEQEVYRSCTNQAVLACNTYVYLIFCTFLYI